MDGNGYLAVAIDPETQLKDSSETAFMTNALNNPDLRVYKKTIAKKILFEGTTAVGVPVETAGLSYTLKASKEVIISAGVVCLLQVFHTLTLLTESRRVHPKCSWYLALVLRRSWRSRTFR